MVRRADAQGGLGGVAQDRWTSTGVGALQRGIQLRQKMNFGVLASRGDRLVFLNDDTEVRTDNWVEELLAPLEEPDVGMTGAMLLFSSNTIQHVGYAYLRGHYDHPGSATPYSAPGPWGSHHINREVSGVTAACSGMRREDFFDVGGFAEVFPAIQRCRPLLQVHDRIAHCHSGRR
ncbi:MAG: glycosyltransferase [Marmoricola sp.]